MPPYQPAAEFQADTILSVSGLNRLARDLLEANFPAVVVEGEVSNLATPASGHWYLTLKDNSAQIRCAMFVNRNRLVRFRPENGKQIIVRGRLSIYEGRGDYQLIADSMEEAGDGALRRAFEELKARLQDEGLFDAAQKQEIHAGFRHIGLITSATGAAIRDMLAVFRRRFPATRLTLFPVAVQGAEAPGEIVRAIALANRLRARLGLEALILGRGGGSLEDLQAFNEEAVARAIHASELPLTSAVGHEIDFTIADFVADLRAPTPSAAAELMSPDQLEYFETLEAYRLQFTQLLRGRLQQARQSLDYLWRRLKRPDRRLQEQAQNLDRLEGQLQKAMANRLALHRAGLAQMRRALLAASPLHLIRESVLVVGNRWKQLLRASQGLFSARRAALAELSRSLDAVSPLNTLARGYSITYDDAARVLRDSADVKIGSRIVTRLRRGRLHSTVASISRDGDED